MKNRLALCALLIFIQAVKVLGQSSAESTTTVKPAKRQNITEKPYLFQYGIANGFIEGIYEGRLSINELKKQGDFGIGAPNFVNGELTVVDGKAYQTNAKGQTIEAPGNLMTPFAFVTKFKKDTVFRLTNVQSIGELFTRIETALPNPNVIYALRIKGTFLKMKTRAFPPIQQKPFKPLAQMIDQQRFFEFGEMQGDMIGFYMPGYLSGINITGLHFHFLSADRKSGGHVVALAAANLTVEVTELNGFKIQVLDTDEFKNFKFNGGNNSSLQKIEKGSN